MSHTRLFLLILFLSCLTGVHASEFTWQAEHAKRSKTGDISWQPHAYQFKTGDSIRYIDFENGDDNNNGTDKSSPWKHHPWDADATGKSVASTGIHSYIFKGGVIYRGTLSVKEQGEKNNPIRLCSDPNWGIGPAILSGAERITGFQTGQAPKGAPNKQAVLTKALDFLPRNVWVITKENKVIRLALARLPNWRSTDRDDIKKDWWTWKNTGPGIHHYNETRKVGRMKLNYGNDPDNITPAVAKIIKNAYVWTEYGWVMGTPFPSRVRAVYPKESGIALGGQWGDNSGSHIVRGCRYYFDDKAEFLDDTKNGEFWFEKTSENGGRLHIILPNNLKIDNVHIEAARHTSIIDGTPMNHMHISGLHFQFTNTAWALDAAGGNTAAIVCNGSSDGLHISNCTFTDVAASAYLRAIEGTDVITNFSFHDNDVNRTDQSGINIRSGTGNWQQCIGPFGIVQRISILRNRFQYTGRRPTRHGQGHCLHAEVVRNAHIAGNVLDMCWGAGIFVFGGKKSSSEEDVPFTRLLIHQNKVTNAVLNTNDWGGIETWQGGSAYVFNNISGDIRGYWHYNFIGSEGKEMRAASFGHAYYLDGAYKNFHFNNIAYGRTRDPQSPLQTCSAFQQIHSYQNTFFNNSAYSFQIATRRQAPIAGRDKFLSNIFDGTHKVFRHADEPKNTEANADHAGDQGHGFAYDTLAYGNNILYDFKNIGLFEEDGTEYSSLKDYAAATTKRKTLRSDVGQIATSSPLPNGDSHDFTASPIADGLGSKVFVPWTLYRCVAEWHFYPSKKDQRIIDEHWDMPPYYINRKTYHDNPSYPLLAQGGVSQKQTVVGPLEDWCKGAVQLDGKTHHYVCKHDNMMKPFSYSFKVRKQGHPQFNKILTRPVKGKDIKNPQIHDSNFLIEIYAKFDSDGLIISKMDDKNGYALHIKDGTLQCTVKHNGKATTLHSKKRISGSNWQHLIVEADRQAQTITIYLNGKQSEQGPGIGAVSLANNADLFVGGHSDGEHIKACFDFMRISHGTLADAETSIEELYAWQFNGPQFGDFSGQEPRGKGRDAGAIESH